MTIYRLWKRDFSNLFSVLKSNGHQVVGPKESEGAIIYGELNAPEDLPIGLEDEQGPGRYRLKKRSDKSYFAYTLGPQTFKKFFDPIRRKLWTVSKNEKGHQLEIAQDDERPFALLGVRACELAALDIFDRVQNSMVTKDAFYQKRKAESLLIAIHCQRAASECLCPSAGTGPGISRGYDLLLTEFIDEKEDYFFVQAGSEKGQGIVDQLKLEKAPNEAKAQIDSQVAATEKQISKSFDAQKAKEGLLANPKHPQWKVIADQCTSCANCTLVCPTCFCSTVDDVTDLQGEHSERWQRWDSCFNPDHSYIHGGAVHTGVASRYRQWLTHKHAYWDQQFDSSGCVGCGRCITWCPVGIDFTSELKVFEENS